MFPSGQSGSNRAEALNDLTTKPGFARDEKLLNSMKFVFSSPFRIESFNRLLTRSSYGDATVTVAWVNQDESQLESVLTSAAQRVHHETETVLVDHRTGSKSFDILAKRIKGVGKRCMVTKNKVYRQRTFLNRMRVRRHLDPVRVTERSLPTKAPLHPVPVRAPERSLTIRTLPTVAATRLDPAPGVLLQAIRGQLSAHMILARTRRPLNRTTRRRKRVVSNRTAA